MIIIRFDLIDYLYGTTEMSYEWKENHHGLIRDNIA
jgi:hypothetical protein